MSNFLKCGVQWMHQTLAGSCSETIDYMRHGQYPHKTEMQAAIGETEYPVDETDGVFIKWQWRDFIILKEKFRQSNGRLYLPELGDQILYRRTAEDRLGSPFEEWGPRLIFEVRSPGNEPAWRYSDRFETALRIHTQVVENTQNIAAEETL